MPFSYKAMDKNNHLVMGVSSMTTKDEVIASLRKQNLRPITIKPKRSKMRFLTGNVNPKKVRQEDLVIFTRQLSTMIGAGVPLARSLAALQADSENPYLREILSGVVKDVESGQNLANSFAKYPKVFSDVYINMVRAGEAGGILDDILKRLAEQVELDASIKKKIKSAMMYPIVILCVTVIGFFGIMLFIVPKIGQLTTSLGGPNAKLPAYTRALLAISNFCVRPSIIQHIPGLGQIPGINKGPNLIFIALILAVAAFYFIRYTRTTTGRYWFDGLLLRIPVIKVIVLKIAIARFSRTFASLMGAGVNVLDALSVTGAALGNKVIQAELENAAEGVKNGKQLSAQLADSPHFPPIVSQMMLVGEETGQIDKVLVKIADFYEEEVGTLINGLASIIEPVMIILLGAAVGLLAASVMGPIADLSKNITPTS